MTTSRYIQDESGVASGDQTPLPSFLDKGKLPVAKLAILAEREGRRPVPIYHAHRWFARRFSSAFRAILVGAQLPSSEDFWEAYYQGVDYSKLTVLDPFVGGGTSVVEAARMGASAIGVDLDPVACAITRFELNASEVPDLSDVMDRLQDTVRKRMARYYLTADASGAPCRILHAFWVQTVVCNGCTQNIEAHPHFQLAFEAEGKNQWAFCRHCHAVHELGRDVKAFRCRACRKSTTIQSGTVSRGRLTCPHCGDSEALVKLAARTNSTPTWRMFAVETIPVDDYDRRFQMTERTFRVATDTDRQLVDAAQRALARRKLSKSEWRGIPKRTIPTEDRSDGRLLHYGYRFYHELFNPRQLLHLSLLAEEIGKVEGGARQALALAFSDHLTTNCMLTYYAFGWRRLAPLFTIRAFRHVCRPVEINPWLDGTGRGTFPNAVRQVQRAIDFARAPEVAHLDGGFVPSGTFTKNIDGRTILHGDSRKLAGVADKSVDLILTDPPYFDNIAYAELSDFFLPWLQQLGLAAEDKQQTVLRLPATLGSQSRNEDGYVAFRLGLAECFGQMRRVLKNRGRLVFSYQHKTADAWEALAHALATGGWRPIQVFPMLGNSSAGLHQHDGTIAWDAVTVCRKGAVRRSASLRVGKAAAKAGLGLAASWARKLANQTDIAFRDADRTNLKRACLIAAALGMFETDGREKGLPLREVLDEN